MIGISRLDDLTGAVTRDFEKLSESKRVPRIVGIVFCQPTSVITTQEIRPSLEYFNFRSGDHVNFYFAGYEMSTLPDKSWIHYAREFNECRNQLEKCSKWRYSGGTDLILCNTRYDEKIKSAVLDFQTAEWFVFEKLKQTGEVPDLKMFFEEIFRYCEENFDAKHPVNPQEASVQHLRATLIKPLMRPNDGLESLHKKLEATLTAWKVDMHNAIAKAEATAEIFKEATQPLREMYKDERMASVKSEAIRRKIPELVVDRIVAEHLGSGFPAIDSFYKTLGTSGDLNRLRKNRRGTSRSQIARHLGIVRKIMERKGLIEKRHAPRLAQRPSIEPYNDGFEGHQNSNANSEPDEDDRETIV